MQNNQERSLLIAKCIDKIRISKTQNKITNSDFLNSYQICEAQKELFKDKNFFFYGGYKQAERKVLIAYPNKLEKEDVIEKINNIITAIKVSLPNEIGGKIKHKDYLGMVMSFGLTRERIGDIIVYDDKAYIIVLKENAEYIKNSIKQERKFKKAKVEIIDINDIEPKQIEFEEIKISVNSLRLDNVVAEILKTSRKIAQDFIEQEKVIINYIGETKNTKTIKQNDILVVRGKGKFIIEEFLGKNKKGKEIIKIKKYK